MMMGMLWATSVGHTTRMVLHRNSVASDGIRRYAECETLIMEHKKGILKLSPGMGADETLEAKLQVCCNVCIS